MNATEAILARRSIRKYKMGIKIPREQVQQILRAAMAAPSACNTRPWEFIVVESEDMKRALTQAHPYCQSLSQASLAIVVCGLPELQQDIASGFWPQDCAAATENILLQATELGYGSCWCGIHPREARSKAIAELLGARGVPFSIVVIGVAGEQPAARGYFDAERVRYI